MNIPIDQIKALRKTIELGAKGVTSLPLEEITPALREVIEQGSREINSLVNVLILLENPGIAKELEDLTEQCGVNTSNTFNTPPPRPAFLERDIKNVSEGVLHPSDMELGEDWPVYTLKFKCNQCAAEWSFLSEIPSDNSGCPRGACGGFVASYHSESHSLNALKKEKQEFLKEEDELEEEDEVVPGVGKTQTPDPKFTPKPPGELDPEVWKCNEPREANPVEVLFDYISEAFTDEHSLIRPANDTKNWYPEGMDQLCAPSHLRNLMVRAQDFLDDLSSYAGVRVIMERLMKNKTD
jgi:hypothetical protein